MSMYPIATYTNNTAGANYINLTSIPQGFTHLQLRCWVKAYTNTVASFYIYFNGDSTGSNSSSHYLYGNGSSAISGGYTNSGSAIGYVIAAPAPGTAANVYAPVICDILDYTNTNKGKTLKGIGGWDNNGSGAVELFSGAYFPTTAISSLTLGCDSGFAAGTRFDLYGITTA